MNSPLSTPLSGYFRAELSQNSPEPITFYEVSLQPVRSNENSQEKPILDYMHAMFANRRLDLVVPIGGPAVRFAQKYRQDLFPETPMLLAATDQRHLNMAAFTSNDAIVSVLNDGPLMIDNILRLFPQTTSVCRGARKFSDWKNSGAMSSSSSFSASKAA